MNVSQVIFVILSAIVLVGAVGVVTNRNLFRSALLLVLSFVGIAGFYILRSKPNSWPWFSCWSMWEPSPS